MLRGVHLCYGISRGKVWLRSQTPSPSHCLPQHHSTSLVKLWSHLQANHLRHERVHASGASGGRGHHNDRLVVFFVQIMVIVTAPRRRLISSATLCLQPSFDECCTFILLLDGLGLRLPATSAYKTALGLQNQSRVTPPEAGRASHLSFFFFSLAAAK